MLAVSLDSTLRYPTFEDAYSPSEAYPEYRFASVASRPNRVYAAVRSLLHQAGLDRDRFGTPDWNPFVDHVARGSRVFVLCNFVYQPRPVEPEEAFWSKCTHGSVLRALVDYLLIATGSDGNITFGNAPLQACDWDSVQEATGADRVLSFYAQENQPVAAQDLRFLVTERAFSGRVRHLEKRPEDAVPVELGSQSLLSRNDGVAPKYRVSDYDPRRTEGFHARDRHIYVMHRAPMEADVVFSLPKLKTHEKVGITCVIKGFVGAVGSKDCLAHHRFGPPSEGGDEYPEHLKTPLKWASRFHDFVQTQPPTGTASALLRVVDRNVRRALNYSGHTLFGAWHGNDTTWRMAVDLARILHYADAHGQLQASPQRKHLALINGILAGEGNGPLAPRPIHAGALVLSDNVVSADLAACRLMGYDFRKLPMLFQALALSPQDHPLFTGNLSRLTARLGEQTVPWDEIPPAVGRPFLPPKGWRGYLDAP